jgi:uncharacterized protein (DUF885 family)
LFNRRDLLLRAAAAAIVTPAFGLLETSPAAAASDKGEAAKLNALLDKFAAEQLKRTPETATGLGLDKGKLAGLKSKLSDYSLAASEKERRDCKKRLAELKKIDRSKLSGIDAANYDTVLFVTEVEDEGNSAFDYGGGGSGSPYLLSQLTGAYQFMPDFMDTQHSIETKADADAYLARMTGLATAMDQELEQVRHDAARGVAPPDFVLDKTLIQMKAFLDTPVEEATLVASIMRRAKEKKLPGTYGDKAASIYADKIVPALTRQADYLKELRTSAVHDAGIARLPKGPDYYRISLKQYTTSTMSPDEIHKTGLELVESISAELDALLKSQGMTEKSVGLRMAALTADPRYVYANTDEAKDKLIADLNAKIVVVQAKLPEYFGALPKAKVEIRRVPKATEVGAPGGYYQPGSLDGSRPGAYYINLRDTAEVPSWTLPTLTFHEAIPGHHLQGTLSNEAKGLPLLRKMTWFSGYGEGWALYAEQLAVEMGMYERDIPGHMGQLQDALFRAVRLVVDTGMHAMGWSREKAIAYYVDALGKKESEATTEVERYCVWPGQACSYMLGKITWLKLRAQAREALGAKFDIRKFHDAGLLTGALPLAVLETVIGDYVKAAKE